MLLGLLGAAMAIVVIVLLARRRPAGRRNTRQ